MNKLILALVIVPTFLISGCVTETVYYAPAYTTSTPAVSVGYVGPYWNNAYYYGYSDLSNVGYWGMYDSYNVY